MYMNYNCENPNEFVDNGHGVLIQRKFLREEEAQPDKTEFLRILIQNQSIRDMLVKKAENLEITPEECIRRALDEFCK